MQHKACACTWFNVFFPCLPPLTLSWHESVPLISFRPFNLASWVPLTTVTSSCLPWHGLLSSLHHLLSLCLCSPSTTYPILLLLLSLSSSSLSSFLCFLACMRAPLFRFLHTRIQNRQRQKEGRKDGDIYRKKVRGRQLAAVGRTTTAISMSRQADRRFGMRAWWRWDGQTGGRSLSSAMPCHACLWATAPYLTSHVAVYFILLVCHVCLYGPRPRHCDSHAWVLAFGTCSCMAGLDGGAAFPTSTLSSPLYLCLHLSVLELLWLLVASFSDLLLCATSLLSLFSLTSTSLSLCCCFIPYVIIINMQTCTYACCISHAFRFGIGMLFAACLHFACFMPMAFVDFCLQLPCCAHAVPLLHTRAFYNSLGLEGWLLYSTTFYCPAVYSATIPQPACLLLLRAFSVFASTRP